MESRIGEIIEDGKVHIRLGLNNNYYVFCKFKEKLIEVCSEVGRSVTAIYYREEYQCWCIRTKSKSMKLKIKTIKEQLEKI